MKKNGKLTAQQKKERLLITALVAAALVMLVVCIKATPDTPTVAPSATPTVQPTEQTVIPATQSSSTDTTVQPPVVTTAPVEQKPTTTAPAVDETAEILKVVSDSVNKLKSDESSYTGHKVQNININLVDSSVPAVNDIINGVIKAFVKEEILDYDFTNGVSPDPEGDGTVDADDTFPPGDLPFTLTKEGVAKATKTADGANTVYTVVIVAETSTLENPRPPHHNSGADTLDLSSVEIPIVTLTKVDFEYPGAEISVTLNPEGEIVGYHEHLKISGTGEGHGLGITGYGTIEGYIDEKWDISWK